MSAPASLTRRSRLDAVLAHRGGRALLQTCLPGITNSPMLLQLGDLPVEQVVGMNAELAQDGRRLERLWASLEALEPASEGGVTRDVWPFPGDGYELEAPRASAVTRHPAEVTRWSVFELEMAGPRHGNPFTDVELTATFTTVVAATGAVSETTAGGFYDGDGVYRVRFMPPTEGEWSFVTHSNARSLDGLGGTFTCRREEDGSHGPVAVADTFHFAHADGTRYVPIGTTAYAWTHQRDELQEQTLETLAAGPFNKLRMCVFPKSYLFNTNEPELFPYERTSEGWDFTRFNPAFFRKLEQRIAQLGELGVEADVILFHAYDRWGFSDMPAAADDAYVRYVVRRLAAYSNVWWSLANEYDLVRSKAEQDWERLASIVTANDSTGHLRSIHNCFGFYDYSRPWITHSSIQRIDTYRTAENSDLWRERWGKPVVVDECAYEGDIDQGWGNITGEEMVRRFWEGAVRGAYVGHGETYLNDAEELWWSKGGRLVGDSPARIEFLAKVLSETPGGVWDPLKGDWDAPRGGVEGRCELVYFGFNRPRYRMFVLPLGVRCRVDVIDTWNMTVERIGDVREGIFRVDLPGRQYMAVRLMFE